MPQKMAILKEWFVSTSGDTGGSVNIRQIGQLLVEKGLAGDVDTSVKQVQKTVKMSDRQSADAQFDLNSFNRIFFIPILADSFKDALLDIENQQNSEHLGLNLKMSNFQRSKMISGINSQVSGKVDLDTVFGGEGTSILESDFRVRDSPTKAKEGGV